MLNGQIFFRETDKLSPTGKRQMMFVGIVSVDKHDAIMSEKMCELLAIDHGDHIEMEIPFSMYHPVVDYTNNPETMGATLGELLLKPIWRTA